MAVAFRAAAHAQAASTANSTVTIPSTVQAGDLMLLGYVINSNSTDSPSQAAPVTPSGWTLLTSSKQTDASTVAIVFYKVAASGDASSTVTVTYTGATAGPRNAAQLVAYSGVDNTSPIHVSNQNVAGSASTTHVMPTVTTTVEQCMIVSLYLERATTSTTTLTASSGWTSRDTNYDTAGATAGRCATIGIDGTTPTAAGSGKGGATVTSDQSTAHGFGYTIALTPVTSVQTARPATDVTVTGWTAVPTPGGGVPLASVLADQLDTSYAESPSAPSASTLEVKLPTMAAAPATVTNRFALAGGATSGTIVTSLRQGSTQIAAWTESAPTSTATTYTYTLTSGQMAAVTDLTDLRIRTVVTAS